jgi:hypothetical protein
MCNPESRRGNRIPIKAGTYARAAVASFSAKSCITPWVLHFCVAAGNLEMLQITPMKAGMCRSDRSVGVWVPTQLAFPLLTAGNLETLLTTSTKAGIDVSAAVPGLRVHADRTCLFSAFLLHCRQP